jgi:hypothetical protein
MGREWSMCGGEEKCIHCFDRKTGKNLGDLVMYEKIKLKCVLKKQ